MGRKAIIPLVLGLGIGLLAVKFVVKSISDAQASSNARQIVSMVRAKQDIGAYEEINKESVEVIETADSLLTPANERIEKLESALGRVSAKPIPRGAPVLLSMLAPEGTKPGVVGRIPQGYRAVAVKIDEASSVAYQIQAGAWVDVIVVMDVETAVKGKKETIAEVILQHVQVAAIGHDSSGEQETAGKQMKPAKSATLLVPEQEVPKLHLAGTRGKITLAMRGEDDTVAAGPATAHSSEIFGNMTQPEPAPPVAHPTPEPAPRPAVRVRPEPELEPSVVMVFRGTTMSPQPGTVERITFEDKNSSKILEVQGGAPTRAGSTLGHNRAGRAQPNRANQNTNPTPPTDASDFEADDESKSNAGE